MRYNKHSCWLVFLLIASLFALSLACTPRATAPQSNLSPVPHATQAQAKAPWENEWDKLIAAAKKEGRLSIYIIAPSPSTSNFIKKSAREKFGIDVELSAMLTVVAQEKITRETKAGIFSFDVNMVTMGTSFIFLEKIDFFEPLDKVIFRPDVLDDNLWMDRSLFLNKAHTAAGGFAGVNPLITINTELVRPGEIRSLEDLLNPKWKGRIIINDPTTTGTGNGTMKTILVFKGEDFIRKLVEQSPTVTRDARIQTEWLARGKYAVSLGPSFGIIKDFIETGSPLAYILPSEGAFMSNSPGAITLAKNAPHPNAARLFINWILTREAQIEFSRAQDTASRRLDAGADHLAPERRPRPETRYFRDTDDDYWIKHEEQTNKIKEIFKPVM